MIFVLPKHPQTRQTRCDFLRLGVPETHHAIVARRADARVAPGERVGHALAIVMRWAAPVDRKSIVFLGKMEESPNRKRREARPNVRKKRKINHPCDVGIDFPFKKPIGVENPLSPFLGLVSRKIHGENHGFP